MKGGMMTLFGSRETEDGMGVLLYPVIEV
jgi:hypothetical protein